MGEGIGKAMMKKGGIQKGNYFAIQVILMGQ